MGAGPGLMNAATNGTLQVEKLVSRFKIGMGIPSMIRWSFDGKQVAIEGSWDNWRTRDFLQTLGKDFTINEGAPIRCFTITSLSLMDNGENIAMEGATEHLVKMDSPKKGTGQLMSTTFCSTRNPITRDNPE
ncbi:hypothetical protein RHMOL_Rhmol02G0250300 [Rhododendron molle]|uniref:Uncharacterized protein n=1 Tax=Rhododendron molle TaxID=49168 RepID=A0ACC0PTJ3_RHOML|nr:hypothetical protein RHMOL_Rhmol02G0250300 [Rhododendron molle]